MAYKGRFSPKNPQKYVGDSSNIIYRSLWELKLMMKFDSHPDVLQWNSEETRIRYRSPLDNKIHTYYPDFWVKKKRHSDGLIEINLIEVKPKKQTKQPAIIEGKPTRKYINEVATWGINSAKWKAAQAYCQERGWKFVILTEDELGVRF